MPTWPYSHSIVTSLAFAILAGAFSAIRLHRPVLGIAIAIGVISHLVLDLITHARDIAVMPGVESIKLGLGLYSAFPLGAFVLELFYGLFCCR